MVMIYGMVALHPLLVLTLVGVMVVVNVAHLDDDDGSGGCLHLYQ